jgi:hypothetical protein
VQPDAGVAQPGADAHLDRTAIAKASGIALLTAVAILVTVVLPAEYGIDPLGTGNALGLTALTATVEPAPLPLPAKGAQALAPVTTGAVALYPDEYKVDSREFVLGPYEYVEYKYHLAKGAQMLFSWSATAEVVHDFHGDPDGAPASAAQSFDKGPMRGADGSFTAPFSGIHGWYWENPGGDTIEVTVTTSGFYTAAHEFNFDGTRRPRDVRAVDTIATERD